MKTTRIHVNQHIIRSNRNDGTREPVITVKTSNPTRYAHVAIIRDANGNEVARVVYRPDKPLSCGAHVWVETQCTVDVVVQEVSDG